MKIKKGREGMKNRNRAKVSMKWIMVLCLVSFGLGILFSNRFFFFKILDRVSLCVCKCVFLFLIAHEFHLFQQHEFHLCVDAFSMQYVIMHGGILIMQYV